MSLNKYNTAHINEALENRLRGDTIQKNLDYFTSNYKELESKGASFLGPKKITDILTVFKHREREINTLLEQRKRIINSLNTEPLLETRKKQLFRRFKELELALREQVSEINDFNVDISLESHETSFPVTPEAIDNFNDESDNESAYSLDLNTHFDRKEEKRVLQVVITDKDFQYPSQINKDLKAQKEYYHKLGFNQNEVFVSVNQLITGGIGLDLEQKMKWLNEVQSCIIQINDHGLPIDYTPESDLSSIIQILKNHGLQSKNDQKDCQFIIESCYSGLRAVEIATESLLKNNITGYTCEGSNHVVEINQKKYRFSRKKIHPTAKIGEPLVKLGYNKNKKARKNATDEKGNYLYKTAVKIYSDKHLETVVKKSNIGSQTQKREKRRLFTKHLNHKKSIKHFLPHL